MRFRASKSSNDASSNDVSPVTCFRRFIAIW
jgi:hypothetical protein